MKSGVLMKAKIVLIALGTAVGPAALAMAALAAMPQDTFSSFSHKFHVEEAGFKCADCHNSLFQQAWGTAKAAGDFSMGNFEKGKYCGACHDGVTAFAVTDQGSCDRCHGGNMKPPKTVVFEQPVKSVVFEHSRHVDQFSLPCSSCHERLFKMKIGESVKQPDFTMAAMYQGKYCGACHDGASAFSLKTRCAACHGQGYNGKEHKPGGT
jgi:c(7)-type cytochrome triheme protein